MKDRMRKAAQKAKDGASRAMDASAPVARAAIRKGRKAAEKTLDGVSAAKAHTVAAAHGLIASDMADKVNETVQSMVKGPSTWADKAMDADYIATHIGGGKHRLMDGGHTVVGSAKAVAEAAPPDTTAIEAAAAWATSYAKDLSTSAGMPIVNMSKDTYNALAERVGSLGISRDRFADMISFDAAEVFGAFVGALAVALRWKDAQAKEFAKIAAGCGMAAAMSSNPLLACVSIVALAKAYVEKDGNWRESARGAVEGAAVTGTSFAVGSAVATAGGPAAIAIIASIAAAMAVNKLMTADTAWIDFAEGRLAAA